MLSAGELLQPLLPKQTGRLEHSATWCFMSAVSTHGACLVIFSRAQDLRQQGVTVLHAWGRKNMDLPGHLQ